MTDFPPDTQGMWDYQFINNVFADFFKDSLDYFVDYLYPRFETRVIGTYDKAVQYLVEKNKLSGREEDKPNLPALILNPSGDYDIADTGKELWRFPNLAGGFATQLFKPVYQDANVMVTVGFTRLKGDIELIALVNSFYEYCDLKILFLQTFGGFNRPIYPLFFHSFIIVNNSLFNYEYYNPVTGLRYTLDWESASAYTQLIKTIDQEKWVIPCRIKPWYILNSVSDASTRYGGAEDLADWRLSMSITYEVELPTFFVMKSDYLAENLKLQIDYGSCYSVNTSYAHDEIPQERDVCIFHRDHGLDQTSNSVIHDSSATIILNEQLVFNNRFYYIITQDQVDSTSDFTIALPTSIDDPLLIILNSRTGEWEYWSQYQLVNDGKEILVKRNNVIIRAGEILELYLYKRKVITPT